GKPVDWVDMPPPFPLKTLTLDQILEMRDSGIAFGSHSYSHADLTQLSEAECERDLRASREALEELLGRSVPHLAYPRGRHNARVRRAAERAGFSHAFSLPERAEPRGNHAVPRVGIYGASATTLRLKSSRLYLPLRTGPAYPLARTLLRRGSPAEKTA
ncbi:MAG: polysaccharide deacetylase family protein, partial [Candidatus Rokuibacteriota bacterium]